MLSEKSAAPGDDDVHGMRVVFCFINLVCGAACAPCGRGLSGKAGVAKVLRGQPLLWCCEDASCYFCCDDFAFVCVEHVFESVDAEVAECVCAE